MSVIITNNPSTDAYLKRHGRFFKQLVTGVTSFHELGIRLVKIAEQARDFHQDGAMKEAALALSDIPLKPFQAIGLYHLGLYQHRTGVDSQRILEQVIEEAPTEYRAWGMLTLAANYNSKQDYASELYWRLQAAKLHPSIESLRSVAVFKAQEGYHRQALRDLENLVPLLKHAEPRSYYDHLNSLAVELGHAGRLEEARNICKIVLASPFTFAYREWRETAEELRGAERSFVVVDLPPRTASNVLFMPAPQTAENPAPPKLASRPARVFNLQQWKRKVVKEPDGNNRTDHRAGQMSDRKMLLKIAELASTDGLPDRALGEMVGALERIVEAHKQKES